jgi:hypothetical protein
MESHSLDAVDELVRHVDETLELAFGTRFVLWVRRDECWVKANHTNHALSALPAKFNVDSHEPCCESIGNSEQLLTLPFALRLGRELGYDEEGCERMPDIIRIRQTYEPRPHQTRKPDSVASG